MTGTDDAVAAEIRALRKGRGIHAADLAQRVPARSHLRDLAGVTGEDVGALRQALSGELANCAAGLPDDLRTAVLASLGILPETRAMRTFDERVDLLARTIGYAERTSLRRIDDAEKLLAEAVTAELRRRRGRAANAPTEWEVDELRTLLRLDTDTPEAHEHRRIIATRDGLREVMAWHDVPAGPDGVPELEAEELYGCRILRREQPSTNRFEFVVYLPEPLRVGEPHEFGLIVRVRKGQMRPHYIFTPECRCRSFQLRVRFGRERPLWVRKVEAETVRTFDAGKPGDNIIQPDETGEVSLSFHNPTMYLGYGAQWRF